MYFPALLTWLRRVGCWLTYEWYQLALWLAFGLHLITSVRSTFRSSSVAGGLGPAVRPRRFQRRTNLFKSPPEA